MNVGDEGGFAPPIDTFEQALDLLTEAIATAGYTGKVRPMWVLTLQGTTKHHG